MLENTPGSESTADTTPDTTPDTTSGSTSGSASGSASGTDAGDTAAASPAGRAPAKKAAAKKAAAKTSAAKKTAAKKAAAKKTPAKKAAAKTTATKQTTTKQATAKKATKAPGKKAADAPVAQPDPEAPEPSATESHAEQAPAARTTKRATARKSTAKKATVDPGAPAGPSADAAGDTTGDTAEGSAAALAVPLFQAPDARAARTRKRPAKKAATAQEEQDTSEKAGEVPAEPTAEPAPATGDDESSGPESGEGGARRRRRRGGRRRRKSGGESESPTSESGEEADSVRSDDQGAPRGSDEAKGAGKGQRQGKSQGKGQGKGQDEGQGKGKGPDASQDKDKDGHDDGDSSTTRRRRRRRRAGEDSGDAEDDPQNTVTRVRKTRAPEDQITALSGSTRLEAKKQRRREGREAGRRRAPIVSEAEFLARRESVERVMAIRQRDDLTQIAVLEDKVLVEHYVARESQTSLIGNVYLGRVQNVLPSMEAAFIDIGRGRNAVLYAGEVNWSALGHKDGQPRKIESVLSSGQSVLVQVTKDPVGHKGARLTSQISLAGRFLVYVPDGTNSGISRKLPDTERSRLKSLLKEIVPDGAGVIVRTAAEGASEEELTRDVQRLTARWADIEKKAKGSAPQVLYGEPDLTLKVVRDLFTEDFAKLVIQGDDAWDTVHDYVTHVAPDLLERVERYDDSKADLFTTYRIDEQIHKGLDRKVWLPSGGSLIIDRTEAMTVVDVNTGKFTGSGGNLEETVTKNNLEAAEEIVRQLRLRDIGGIIVVDFIDMVLESNRDLVLRRLVECLGRDRTRHQVAEVTSLGLVQMTRKRIGTGLLEAFSEPCEHCGGRGLIVADAPIEPKKETETRRTSRRSRGGRGRAEESGTQPGNGHGNGNGLSKPPSPKDIAAMARPPQDDTAEDHTGDQAKDDAGQEPEPMAADEAQVESQDEPQDETQVESQEEPQDEPLGQLEGSSSPTPTEEAEQPERPADEEPPTTSGSQDAAVEDPAEASKPLEPAAPKVVTRTRRRSASRPAGPPAAASAASAVPSMAEAQPPGVVGDPADHGAVEPGTAASEIGGKPVVEHVPVKKRGSRKR